MSFKLVRTRDFSDAGSELYKVVSSGFCMPQYNTKAATAVMDARSVGNARLKPG